MRFWWCQHLFISVSQWCSPGYKKVASNGDVDIPLLDRGFIGKTQDFIKPGDGPGTLPGGIFPYTLPTSWCHSTPDGKLPLHPKALGLQMAMTHVGVEKNKMVTICYDNFPKISQSTIIYYHTLCGFMWFGKLFFVTPWLPIFCGELKKLGLSGHVWYTTQLQGVIANFSTKFGFNSSKKDRRIFTGWWLQPSWKIWKSVGKDDIPYINIYYGK